MNENFIITENELLEYLKNSKRVFLLEPNYKRSYPPLGLNKISSFVKNNGGKIWNGREYNGIPVDLICVTSSFTYLAPKVLEAIEQARFLSKKTPIIIGGVYATLLPNDIHNKFISPFIKSSEEINIKVFKGYSPELDKCIPDYSLEWQLEEPWNEFSFVFTSRGCPNKCSYCAAWRIEGRELKIIPNWKEHIVDDKSSVVIEDNNISASNIEHVKEVIEYLALKNKKVIFEGGLDVKWINPEMAKLLSRLRFTRSGMRVAFDRIEEDGIFQNAVKMLLDSGISKSNIKAFILFNFKDTPQEAHYRAMECVRLGIKPYPQRFAPLNKTTSNTSGMYIGKYWSKPLCMAFRRYWLFAEINRKMSFEKSVKSLEGNLRFSMEDWEKWFFKK